MSNSKKQVFKSFKDAFNLKEENTSKKECMILKDGKPLNEVLEEQQKKKENK